MERKKWKKIAETLLKEEAEAAKLNFPVPEGMVLQWRNSYYFGSLQRIAENFSPEIVLLSKTSKPIKKELVEAILEIQPERPKIIAEDYLDLEGRTHILRRIGQRLTKCTSEQTKCMIKHMPYVFEV